MFAFACIWLGTLFRMLWMTFSWQCADSYSCVNLLPPPDDMAFLRTAYNIYLSQGKLTHAMALAVRLDDMSPSKLFYATEDKLVHKQLAFILARQQIWLEVEDEEVQECLSNTRLSENFYCWQRSSIF